MRWFIPSWNGDFRFEPNGEGASKLVVEKPTPLELEALTRWLKVAAKEKWVENKATKASDIKDSLSVNAPVPTAAAAMAKILNHKRAGVITAFRFADGKIEVTEAIDDLPRWARKLAKAAPAPEAAVTVHRPSLSCPECEGKNEHERKACDVLWEFLNPRQRAEWLKDRAIRVVGNLTRHVYRVSSRDTEAAKIVGRCTVDETDRLCLHHYDWTVPPEEEVLAIKLILEHRENWLRVFGEVDPFHRAEPGTIFENPFRGRALFGI